VRNLVALLDRLIGWIAAAALGITFMLLAFSVFARYFAPSLQPQWVFEVCVFLLVWAILLGVARIERRAGHIRVDFLLDMMGPRAKVFLEGVSLLFGLAVAVLFIWSGWIVVQDAILWDERTESHLRLPFWIFYASLSVSFAIHLIFIVERMSRLITDGESAMHPSRD
jgi:TRAP-type C4-dicarboxylate transport system permease small subunit